MVDDESTESDDSASLFSGDLGLGLGLKPGGLPKYSPLSPRQSRSLPNSPERQTPILCPVECYTDNKEGVRTILKESGHWNLANFFEKITSRRLRSNATKERESLNGSTGGSSIHGSCKKCQKSSAHKKLRMRRNSDSALSEKTGNCKPVIRRTKSGITTCISKPWNYFQDHEYKTLQHNLQKAKEEIDTLNSDLEHYQKELRSKYGTMKVIHMHSRLERAHSREMTRKALEASKRLEQEVNLLQWELELKQSYLMDSEQTWAERFDRVATENAALLVALHTRSDELRKLAMEKIALIRERDELAAALEVRDMIRGDSTIPDEEGPFSSEELIVELATLGACQCRGQNQEPCGCARAAVDSKREFGRLKKQLESSRHQEEEALLTADAYRVAFEQQLNRNSSLIYELLHTSVPAWKNKLLLKTKKSKEEKILGCNEEDFLQQMRSRNDELVQRLVDMLSDKSEALAHQKMATKMLASKLRDQERVIQRYKAHERLIIPSTDVPNYEPESHITV